LEREPPSLKTPLSFRKGSFSFAESPRSVGAVFQTFPAEAGGFPFNITLPAFSFINAPSREHHPCLQVSFLSRFYLPSVPDSFPGLSPQRTPSSRRCVLSKPDWLSLTLPVVPLSPPLTFRCPPRKCTDAPPQLFDFERVSSSPLRGVQVFLLPLERSIRTFSFSPSPCAPLHGVLSPDMEGLGRFSVCLFFQEVSASVVSSSCPCRLVMSYGHCFRLRDLTETDAFFKRFFHRRCPSRPGLQHQIECFLSCRPFRHRRIV